MIESLLWKTIKDKIVTIIKIIVIIMVLWGLQKEHYIYYQTLRRIVLVVTVYLAYKTYIKKQFILVWALIITAIVFNPIFHIVLPRNVRQVLNILVAVELIATIIDDSIFTKKISKK